MAEADKTRDNVRAHGNHAIEVMTREVATVEEDASLAKIATILEDKKIKLAITIFSLSKYLVIIGVTIQLTIAARI